MEGEWLEEVWLGSDVALDPGCPLPRLKLDVADCGGPPAAALPESPHRSPSPPPRPEDTEADETLLEVAITLVEEEERSFGSGGSHGGKRRPFSM
jgi:hypothetical protein